MTGLAIYSLFSLRMGLERYVSLKEKKRLSKKAQEVLNDSMFDTAIILGYIALHNDETPETIVEELMEYLDFSQDELHQFFLAASKMIGLVEVTLFDIEHAEYLRGIIAAGSNLLKDLLAFLEGGDTYGSKRAS